MKTRSILPTILRRLALLIVLVGCFALLHSCGDDKSVTFKSAGMTHTFNQGDVTKELQPFVYPGATVIGSTSASDNDGEQSAYLSLKSTDTLEKVSGWYEDTLKKDGWKLDSDDTMPRMINLSGHKEDFEIAVMMSEDNASTTISVSQGRAIDKPVDEEEIENFTPNELTPPTE